MAWDTFLTWMAQIGMAGLVVVLLCITDLARNRQAAARRTDRLLRDRVAGVNRIVVRPGDMIVVRVNTAVDPSEAQAIGELFHSACGCPVRVVVIGRPVDLIHLRPLAGGPYREN